MPISARPAADDLATRYACDVLDDKVVAGELVKAACQRHLRDLDGASARGLSFDVAKADHACGFYPAVLTVTEGAKEGQPFTLLPWHGFVAASLFGWRDRNGLRRFRMAWMETGKGQAKSPFMAGTGLLMMGFAGKPRSEVYAIAGDKDQANVLFRDAVAMCRAPTPNPDGDTDSLDTTGQVVLRGTGDMVWKIEHPGSQSRFEPIASLDAISGPKPYLVVADEIHEFKTGYGLSTCKAAIDKVAGDPMMMLGTNTPATNQIVGTEYSDLFTRVVTGQAEDDSLFGFIAKVDKADEETVFDNEACWGKALPALGVTFPVENIRKRVNTARLMLSEALSTKRLYFGIRVGSEAFWTTQEAWESCQGEVDEEEMQGLPCWLSLDLSKKNDLTALSACWKGTKDGRAHKWVKTWYFTTKAGILDRSRDDKVPYDLWAEAELIEAAPGATIDYAFVARRAQKLAARHKVRFLAFDAAKMDDFIDACDAIGFDVWRYEGPDEPAGKGLMLVAHGQGTRIVFVERALCMPRSIEKLEDAIKDGAVTVEASPVTTMCAANAIIKADEMGNRAFDKKRSRGRIDGLVTIAMSAGAAENEFPEKRSVYADRGMLFV